MTTTQILTEIYKEAQRLLPGYAGKIDGIIGKQSKAELNKIPALKNTSWDAERKAVALFQIELKGAAAGLVIDGLFGNESTKAAAAQGYSWAQPSPAVSSFTYSPFIQVPRWNVDTLPTFQPTAIILHRTAGYYSTGDYAVGRYGHSNGPATKGKSLGFQFLIGKNKGEAIQFTPANRMLSHVKRHHTYTVGIELSGDVGQWNDGLKYGEPLTDWQLEQSAGLIRWLCDTFGISPDFPAQAQAMHTCAKATGIMCHRDLTGNDHADGPNAADMARIRAAVNRG